MDNVNGPAPLLSTGMTPDRESSGRMLLKSAEVRVVKLLSLTNTLVKAESELLVGVVSTATWKVSVLMLNGAVSSTLVVPLNEVTAEAPAHSPPPLLCQRGGCGYSQNRHREDGQVQHSLHVSPS